MPEIFNVQENIDQWEWKITMDYGSLFNQLYNLWWKSVEEYAQIEAALNNIQQNIDNFNTWVDKKTLVWKKVLGVAIANRNDQMKTEKWAKDVLIGDFKVALQKKVNELNTLVQQMIDNYSKNTWELQQNIWQVLQVDSFVVSVPKAMMVWDGKLPTTQELKNAQEALAKNENPDYSGLWRITQYAKWPDMSEYNN